MDFIVPIDKKIHEENRLSWNAATEAHNSHKRDQATFLRDGGTTLFPEEIELLGDLTGKRLVHLQCNAGPDTLSLAQLGARVTGIDISDTAIDYANRLAADSGIPAEFVRADVYDWLDEAAGRGETYDVVFCSYGAICWLSDLDHWARRVAEILKPDGKFVTVEFHPFSYVFGDDWSLTYAYFAGGAALTWEEGVHDYVADAGDALAPSGYDEGVKEFVNPFRVHEYSWGIGEIVTALATSGLRIEQLREYPFSNGAKLFERMQVEPGNRMTPPEDLPSIPLMYGIVASR
jgi:SAM-dependent methyltransferase